MPLLRWFEVDRAALEPAKLHVYRYLHPGRALETNLANLLPVQEGLLSRIRQSLTTLGSVLPQAGLPRRALTLTSWW